ncbi:MAG: DUF3102 domain-containing protein [Selenomonadaceae bacterium]|nr:DUF3102 domain-containing protein [Selenomonadaceae bacterium]
METIEMTPKPTLLMLELKIKFYLQKTAENVVEIGKRLILAKEMVEHGEWSTWLKSNFNLSYSAAAKFMKVAERFSKVESIPLLGAAKMIAILALPAGDEEKFIAEKAEEGTPVEDMTVKNLRDEVKVWREKRKKQNRLTNNLNVI